jgi:hypothetical protein
MVETSALRLPSPWQAGLRGARANLLPGLVLQGVALALVLAYFHHAPTRAALTHLSAWRIEYGLGFAMLTTGLCGGLLPLLYLRFASAQPPALAPGLILTAFWSYKGLEIDLWYRVLAAWVGEGNSFGVVAAKTVLDQFVYCPLFAVPLTTVVYAWCQRGFNARAVWADMRAPRWYVRRVLPVLLSNLGVWLPAVCIIYTLPTPLQLPLQNVVLCFFTLLLAHLSANEAKADAPTRA